MPRVSTESPAIVGLVNLSQFDDENIRCFVEEAFRGQLGKDEKIARSRSREYDKIWKSLKFEEEFHGNFDHEVIRRAVMNGETVLVGINDSYEARKYPQLLNKKSKSNKVGKDQKISTRAVAEANPTSSDASGTLIAVTKANDK